MRNFSGIWTLFVTVALLSGLSLSDEPCSKARKEAARKYVHPLPHYNHPRVKKLKGVPAALIL